MEEPERRYILLVCSIEKEEEDIAKDEKNDPVSFGNLLVERISARGTGDNDCACEDLSFH